MHKRKCPGPAGAVNDDLRGRQQLMDRIVILYDQSGETAAQSPGLQTKRIPRGGSGTQASMTKRPPGPRCRAAFSKHLIWPC